ncbi:carboxymuconolactone decarboxylase family protein [Streptomyces sp. NPDC002514]|uniref:carboxymuconolactone decarboxylase family protein n=1 Tax=Streptomyces sp. NPDC001270 TaxID=3364554 RepID=UPI0036888EF3
MTARRPTPAAAAPHERLFPGHESTLTVTDPELIEYLAGVFDFSHATNDVLTGRGVELPLRGQSTTSPDTRMEQGPAAQKRIVGDKAVDAMHSNTPADEQHIQELLSGNRFGDHCTRTGIDVPTRELLTFALLAAFGGADAQVKGHAAAGLDVGNTRCILIAVLTGLLPFLGYLRTLSALAAVDAVTPADDAPSAKDNT